MNSHKILTYKESHQLSRWNFPLLSPSNNKPVRKPARIKISVLKIFLHPTQTLLYFLNTMLEHFLIFRLHTAQNLEQGQEEVDDIKVKSHRCPNKFIICVALDKIVSVIDDVSTEYKSREHTIYGHRYRTKREKGLHNMPQNITQIIMLPVKWLPVSSATLSSTYNNPLSKYKSDILNQRSIKSQETIKV